MHTNLRALPADPAHTAALPRKDTDIVVPWLGVLRPAANGTFYTHAISAGWVGTFNQRTATAMLEEIAGWRHPAAGDILRHRLIDGRPLPATPFDELVTEFASSSAGPEHAARAWNLRRDARYLLVEAAAEGSCLLSSHDSIADTAKHADAAGSPYTWAVEALYDLVTGRAYEGVRRTTFHRCDQRHPEAGQPFVNASIPAELTAGRVVGYCGHAVARSEYRVGMHVCERCDRNDYGAAATTDFDA